MRWSQYYLHTTREVPSDAEVTSHRLMMRTGMLRKHAAGIYTYQPFFWRSLRKLMEIVRTELDRAGAIELAMPFVQPAELWRESGRWREYGPELRRLEDRHERDFCLGPTHEEIITEIVRRDVRSYRQLPVNLYQIQTKFRDEVRPRFGVMRAREFIMKDAYSFHTDEASLDEAYRAMHDAYCKIFEACGLDYIVVEADTGSIGGSSSHEFMVVAETGEDAVVRCPGCDYAANVEKATTRLSAFAGTGDAGETYETVDTPGKATVTDVAAQLGIEPSQMVKTLIYETDAGLVAVAIRGDREINEIKLKNETGAEWIRLAEPAQVKRATGAPVGFAGPVGLADDVRLLADLSTETDKSFACGANANDQHLTGVQWKRDASPEKFIDVLLVGAGDLCPKCGEHPLELFRGIEVGHIFKLGTKYSEAMGCNFADEDGQDKPMLMGCYGLGVTRTIAAAIEQGNDDNGIIWPLPLAPFQITLLSLNASKDEAVREAADDLYETLKAANWEVLYDDRPERPGVKFKDADLLGIPLRLVVGGRSLAEGNVELVERRGGEKEMVAVGDVLAEAERRLG